MEEAWTFRSLAAQELFPLCWKSLNSMVADSKESVQEADRIAIERCRSGDHEAFSALVNRYRSTVYNLAYRMVGDTEEAADLAQEAFVRAYGALRSYRGEGSFKTWVCRITARIAIDHLRARRKQSLPLQENLVAKDHADWSESLRVRELLEQAIAELPPHYRAVIILRHLQELSYQEISEVLGLPMATVKTHILRARALLRKKLGPALGRSEVEQDEEA